MVLPETEEYVQTSGRGQEDSNGPEEIAEPRELNRLSQTPTGGKRKETQHKDKEKEENEV